MAIRKRSLLNNLLDRGPMLTPLIDIMFLVLIFFMVNNSPTQRSLEVSPPSMPAAPPNNSSNAPAEQNDNILVLVVRPDLDYRIQLQNGLSIIQEWRSAIGSITKLNHNANSQSNSGGTISVETVFQALQRQLEHLQNSQQIFSQVSRIRLRADRKLDYGRVIAICNILYPWGLPLDLDVSAKQAQF